MDICAWLEEDSGVCAIKTILDRDEIIYCEYCGDDACECEKYVKSAN